MALVGQAWALDLVSVQSRKIHGAAGAVDLRIDHTQSIGGNVTIEPRAIGSGHRIVFQFNGSVTHPGVVVVRDEQGLIVGEVTASAQGQEVTVMLAQIADRKRASIELLDVAGSGRNVSAALGFVLGDVDNSRTVADSDLVAARARSGRTDELLATHDLNTTGVITAADIAAVKTRRGNVLPSAVPQAPPSISTVLFDPTVPANAAALVSRVITPLGSAPPGSNLAWNSGGGNGSIALALDGNGNLLLGAIELGSTTQLGADSTALLLARMALGPLRQGQTPVQVNAAIRNASGYAGLRQAVSDALSLGVTPASQPPVHDAVQIVSAQAAASLGSTANPAAQADAIAQKAAGEPVATTEAGSLHPCTTDLLGYQQIALPLPCWLIKNGPGEFFNTVQLVGSGGLIKNSMPIHWVAQAFDASDVPYPVNLAGVELAIDAATLPSSPEARLPVPPGHGFKVLLKQTNETRIKNLGELIEGVVGLLADQLADGQIRPVQCLAGLASKIFTAEQLETLVASENPLAVWEYLENFGLIGSAQAVLDCYKGTDFKPFDMGTFKAILKGIAKNWAYYSSGALKAVEAGTLIWKSIHTISLLNGRAEATVCETRTFLGGGLTVKCPAAFSFDGPPVILAEGAHARVGAVSRPITIKAIDSTGNPTAVPENLVVTPLDPTTLEWRNGDEVRALPNPAPAESTVFPISTGMRFSFPLTGATGTLPVAVVRPTISPANTVTYEGESATLKLVDHLGRQVTTAGSDIYWVSSNPQIASIPEIYSLFGLSSVEVRGIAPGTTSVAVYNPTSGLTSGATATTPASIEVRPPRGYWRISYVISECGFVTPDDTTYPWYFGDPCGIGTPVDGGNSPRYVFFDDETSDVVFQSYVGNAGHVRTVMPLAFRSTQNQFTWSTGAGVSLNYFIPYSTEGGVATVSGTRTFVFDVTSRTQTSMQGTFRIDSVGARWQVTGIAPSGHEGPTYSLGTWTGTFIPGQRPQTKLLGDYFCFFNNGSMPQMAFPLGPGNPRLMPGWVSYDGLVPTGCIYGN